MEREKGFTLIELMIVVAIIATIAAIALPSLQGARIAGNEASAISSLRILMQTNEQYRSRYATYAPDLAELGTTLTLDEGIASGTRAGYSFAYAEFGADNWDCVASPLSTVSGARIFYCDASGVIRYSDTGVPDETSTPIE